MMKTSHKELNYQVLHLVSWPSVGQLLDETAADITRICALLARRPSVGILIPVMLDLSPQLTFSLLKALYESGNICPVVVPDPGEPGLPGAEPAPGREAVVATSFIGKIWQRLMEKN